MRNEEATKRKITNFPKPHNDINSIMTFYDYDVTQFNYDVTNCIGWVSSCRCSRIPSSCQRCSTPGSSGSCSRCRCPPLTTSTTCRRASGCYGDSFRWGAGMNRPRCGPCTCPSSGSRSLVLEKVGSFWILNVSVNFAASQDVLWRHSKFAADHQKISDFFFQNKQTFQHFTSFLALNQWLFKNLLKKLKNRKIKWCYLINL